MSLQIKAETDLLADATRLLDLFIPWTPTAGPCAVPVSLPQRALSLMRCFLVVVCVVFFSRPLPSHRLRRRAVPAHRRVGCWRDVGHPHHDRYLPVWSLAKSTPSFNVHVTRSFNAGTVLNEAWLFIYEAFGKPLGDIEYQIVRGVLLCRMTCLSSWL